MFPLGFIILNSSTNELKVDSDVYPLLGEIWHDFEYEWICYNLVYLSLIEVKISPLWPCDRSLPSQPISAQKPQSRQKAHKPLRTSKHVSSKTLLFTFSLRVSCCSPDIDGTTCAKDHRHFIIITHKSSRSENSITCHGGTKILDVHWFFKTPRNS